MKCHISDKFDSCWCRAHLTKCSHCDQLWHCEKMERFNFEIIWVEVSNDSNRFTGVPALINSLNSIKEIVSNVQKKLLHAVAYNVIKYQKVSHAKICVLTAGYSL